MRSEKLEVIGGWMDRNCCYHREVAFHYLNMGVISISVSIVKRLHRPRVQAMMQTTAARRRQVGPILWRSSPASLVRRCIAMISNQINCTYLLQPNNSVIKKSTSS